MNLLTGKTALITGATRGIGRAIALRFAQEGAHVAFTYLTNHEKAKSLESELKTLGICAKGYCSDASVFSEAENLIQQVIQEFKHLDILVNNAGITRDNLILRMTEKDWDDVLSTNLKSVFNLTKTSVKYFLKQRSGSIINLSSIVGVNGNAGQVNYAASKAGIIGFSKSMAQEIGSRNIRVNVIAPGFIKTEMTDQISPEAVEKWKSMIPLQRLGEGNEVADAVLFLASDLSSYITGHVLHVDGGMG